MLYDEHSKTLTVKNFNHTSNILRDVAKVVAQKCMDYDVSQLKNIKRRRSRYFRY